MSEIMSTDTWDKIEEMLKAGEHGTLTHTAAKAALEVRLAKETIVQQKRMVRATRVLAVFTVILTLVTGAYTIVTYLAYRGAKDQISAIDNLTSSIKDDLAKTIRNDLTKSIKEGLTKTIKDAAMHERAILRDMVPKKKPSSPQHKAVTGR